MIYYTGDLHGNIERILEWMNEKLEMDENKIYLILLGDAGVNYHLDEQDYEKKNKLQNKIDEFKERGKEIKLLFVRGNHECRPENLTQYFVEKQLGGQVYIEKNFPDLIFLKDGEQYRIDEKEFLVLGGGFSKDFYERILHGSGFWFDEQMSKDEFSDIMERLPNIKNELYVLSHMLPKSISPNLEEDDGEWTEKCLQKIMDELGETKIVKWMAAHYHCSWDSSDKRFQIVYKEIRCL